MLDGPSRRGPEEAVSDSKTVAASVAGRGATEYVGGRGRGRRPPMSKRRSLNETVGERGKTLIEGFDGLFRICCEEFFGLPDVANFEIWLKEIEDIENIGNAPCEGQVYSFNFTPVRKRPVADHEGVGMPDSGDEV